jgi:hypothetical protein
MKTNTLMKNIRAYENLHVALWLIKDACWVMDFRLAGMLMIIPTIAVAIDLAWKSRNTKTDFFHNVAICYWIAANGIWMTGEFFYHDGLRPYAMVLFVGGIAILASYYALQFQKRNKPALQRNMNVGLGQAA